jgi:hypothetical protein
MEMLEGLDDRALAIEAFAAALETARSRAG